MPSSWLATTLQAHWWRPRPSLAMRCLQPVALLLQGLAALHRRWVGAPVPPGVPVIVVGNLVVGGAGKTPTGIALVHWLRLQGWQPGVVSRGYGRQGGEVRVVTTDSTPAQVGDEPLLIHRRTGAPVVVGRDRVAALQVLRAAAPQVDIVVCDDGLQHHRLHRDVELIVFDERGAGNGLTLPAGPLRQPLGEAPWPQALVLYNAPAPSTPWPGPRAQRRLAGALPLADWWRGNVGALQPLAALAGRPLLAAAGMGHPERFFGMLQAEGLSFDRLPLPDHAAFEPLPWPPGTAAVLVTEKDAVKLRPERLGSTQVWVVALDFELPAALTDALAARLAAWRQQHACSPLSTPTP